MDSLCEFPTGGLSLRQNINIYNVLEIGAGWLKKLRNKIMFAWCAHNLHPSCTTRN